MSDKQLRILHFSSHKEMDCGVAKYQNQYVAAMEDMPEVQNEFFGVSPYETRPMSRDDVQKVADRLVKELKDFDILHIQHEFGLYWDDQFAKLVDAGKRAGKKVIVTVHLSPSVAIKPVKLGGIGPKSIIAHLRKVRHRNRMIAYHIDPMKQADALIVHNDITAKSLKGFGVNEAIIHKIPHPVYVWPKAPVSTEVRDNLKAGKNDIVFGIVGFLHRYKGVLGAVRALKYLPPNYKLALLGGVKPDSDDVGFEDRVTNLIDELGVHDRVYITGFLESDERLNAVIQECDVCVYPYDRIYYANLSSGSINLAIANDRPVVAYPTDSIKEMAAGADGAVVLCETFAYYEMARELKRLDIPKQVELSKAYAKKMAWPKMAKKLVELYEETANV